MHRLRLVFRLSLALATGVAASACGSSEQRRHPPRDGADAGAEVVGSGGGSSTDSDGRSGGAGGSGGAGTGVPEGSAGDPSAHDTGAASDASTGATDAGAPDANPPCNAGLSDPYAGAWIGFVNDEPFTTIFAGGVMTSDSANDTCTGTYEPNGDFTLSCAPSDVGGDPTHQSVGNCVVVCPDITCTYVWTILASGLTGNASWTSSRLP